MRRYLVSLLVLLAPALGAQGWIVPRCAPAPMPRPEPGRPAPRPRPPVDCGPAQVVRTGSDVTAELRGRVVHYVIEERFRNRGATIGEADYYFPLPKNAAFQDLKLSIDGELVAGETMSAEQARGVYEAIVRQQRDPALVEWMGHGLLRLRIFPFAGGEERRVVVRLQSVAEREGDALRVEYARGARTSGTESSGARVAFTLSHSADMALGRPYSPTHSLDVNDRGGMRRITADGRGGDVTILLPTRRTDAASIAMLAHAPASEEGYALVTVSPPAVRRAPTPRDFTFVVDVSGSMSGRKLEQAKAAGRQFLAALRPADRFRIVDFSSDARSFRDEFALATPANVREAQSYVERLDAEGGTNISEALDEALRDAPAPDRLGLVLFLTDGAPTAGERDPARIAERAARLRRGRRVFSFGVGADVNAALVEALALEGRGTAHFVRPDESVEHAVTLVASRLADPVLTDVRVTARGARLSRMQPAGELDLFAGQDLVVFARYAGSGSGEIIVEGRSPAGPVRWAQAVTFPSRDRDNAFVGRLWASQRVGWLSAEKRRGNGTSELDDEIRTLGERFGIPTEFTSYLVLEPGMSVADFSGQLRPQTNVRGSIGGGVMPRGGREPAVGRGAAAGNATVAPTAAAPPPPVTAPQAASTAQAQFEAARVSSEQRAARSMDAVERLEQGAAGGERHAAGRRFVQDGDGRWTDVRHTAGSRTIAIAPYSAAWFAVAKELPALRDAFALGERVLVAGRGVSLEVKAGANETLSAAELADLVKGLQ